MKKEIFYLTYVQEAKYPYSSYGDPLHVGFTSIVAIRQLQASLWELNMPQSPGPRAI